MAYRPQRDRRHTDPGNSSVPIICTCHTCIFSETGGPSVALVQFTARPTVLDPTNFVYDGVAATSCVIKTGTFVEVTWADAVDDGKAMSWEPPATLDFGPNLVARAALLYGFH